MSSPSIIVFDGACVLCSRWVDFILRHDHCGHFRLAPMQGVTGRSLLVEHGLSPDDPASFLLVTDTDSFTDTLAIASVLRVFGGRWRVVANLLQWTPRPLIYPVYRWVARHRYRLFGRRDTCRMPNVADAWRFLD